MMDFILKHRAAVYVLTLILMIGGAGAYWGMPREAAPDITVPVVVLSTPYFGVTPEDIETLVTQPLEKELKDLKDVDEMRSTSAEGVSIITVVFEPEVNIDDALQKMREKVDKAKKELPPDAEEPILTEINFSEFPIMLVNVHGDIDPVELKEVAEEIQDELEQVSGVLGVDLAGGVEREIRVEVDPERLEYHGVSLAEIEGALRREHVNLPGGSVDVGALKYLVRVNGEFRDSQTLGEVVVRDEEGQPIRVRDVARVVDGYKEQETHSRFKGQPNVSLSVQKRAGENLLRITDESKVILERWREKLPPGVKITVTADVSDMVNDMVKDLVNNIYSGLVLVIVTLLFFMGGARNSLLAASSIPLSTALTLMILDALGVTLNMVVLFSLVLALGNLVDNGIVIVENIYRHASVGKDRLQAAKDGVEEVIWPMLASSATIVAGFLPMMFWPGIMGEFMGFLPLTVIVVSFASFFVGVVINPVMCSSLVAIPKAFVDEEEVPDNFIYKSYRATIEWALRHRWIVAALSLVALVGTFALYGAWNYGVEFFPETTPTRAFLTVRAPDGVNLQNTDKLSRDIEGGLSMLENLDSYVVNVGVSGGGNDISPGSNQPNRAQFTMEFPKEGQLKEDPFVTLERMRAMLQDKAGAEFEVDKENMGPPSGKPINLELVGKDFHELGALARVVREKISDVPGLVDLKDNYAVGRPELHVEVDRKQAALVGVSTQQVAGTVRTAINGSETIKIRDGKDEINVIVRLQPDARRTLEDISRLKINGRDGALIPLREIATVESRGGTGSVRHLDRDRVITVEANVAAGRLPNDVLADVRDRLSTLDLPKGYQVRYTGQNKEQEEAQVFLVKALLSGIFLIGLILVLQFNSLLQVLTILSSVVLSLIGVLWGLLITQTPFGVIMVGIGIISLAGVVVNNAIVLIDFINQLRARGVDRFRAVVMSGVIRLRPVLLTAITSILALLPMTFGVSFDFIELRWVFGGQSVEMWNPMANAVVFGLAFATALTLVVVPVLYTFMDDLGQLPGRASASLSKLWRRRAPQSQDGAGIQGSRQEAFAAETPSDSL